MNKYSENKEEIDQETQESKQIEHREAQIEEAPPKSEQQPTSTTTSKKYQVFEYQDEQKSKDKRDLLQEGDGYRVPIPQRYFFVSCILFLTGIILLSVGVTEYMDQDVNNDSRDLAFIVLGSLLFIPGAYYSYKLFMAYMSNSAEQRQEIINEFPLDADF